MGIAYKESTDNFDKERIFSCMDPCKDLHLLLGEIYTPAKKEAILDMKENISTAMKVAHTNRNQLYIHKG